MAGLPVRVGMEKGAQHSDDPPAAQGPGPKRPTHHGTGCRYPHDLWTTLWTIGGASVETAGRTGVSAVLDEI
jgi:hypothetical protein